MERKLIIRGGLIAAIFVVGGGTLVTKWIHSEPSVLSHGETEEILIASRYIPAFSAIKETATRAESAPKNFLPPGVLRHASELQNDNGQYVFISAVAIPEGQPLTRSLLVNAEQGPSLAALIRPGRVAVSFEVDKAHGVGGWIKPGDTVALFRSVLGDGVKRINAPMTKLLFPAVPVLAIDTERLGEKPEKPEGAGEDHETVIEPPCETRIVTVLVSPSEASALIEAREHGSLNVVLRAVGDDLPWPAN